MCVLLMITHLLLIKVIWHPCQAKQHVCQGNSNHQTHFSYFVYLHSCRHGTCVPFSTFPAILGSPCDSVYETGTDYVYLSNEVTRSFYEELLNIIHEAENALEEIFIDECTNTTKTMICNYYLPPCGDAARLTTPTSVCPTACEEQSRRCPSQWTWFALKENISQFTVPVSVYL